ncbi:hypothetical protein SAMN05216388_100448 [Halorientalis persicus]|uniref:DUF7979 domain-containing protein n=1 Tax=Halorientalis persicus TaxID=1367881 RepID=A0A1H8I199_9EURY|nr:hypothetical protein [Halorientalis persicus]SEN62259.1 hypothetical protein SAMN05216388_100448 [Halorientalis persicus]
MDWDRGTWLVAVGILMLAVAAVGGFVVFDSDYVHELQNDSAAFDASTEGHLHYANLSERGQEAVDRTIERGEYVVESEAETAPEFMYIDDGDGRYVVQRDGRAYEITTHREGPGMGLLWFPAMLLLLPLGMAGAACIVAGITLVAFDAYRRRTADRPPDEN